MRVFTYAIAADQESPSDEEGFVRAETAEDTLALVGHPEATVDEMPEDAV